MNRATLVALTAATAILGATGIGIDALGEPPASAMTRAQYLSARGRLDVARGWALAACARRSSGERDACEARADADANLRAAQLEVRYRRSPQAARDAQRARIEVRHQAALARCVPLKGYDHDQCLIRAHALLGRALLQSEDPYSARAD
ncbi:MAG TPA: hypothetical protein VLY46_01180 [Usitatibacter sp.]|nr:hypothetical protein [Usitatibacter sp.]